MLKNVSQTHINSNYTTETRDALIKISSSPIVCKLKSKKHLEKHLFSLEVFLFVSVYSIRDRLVDCVSCDAPRLFGGPL